MTEWTLKGQLEFVYMSMEGSKAVEAYSKRHDIRSAAILTAYSDELAATVAEYLAPRIEDRVVVEIGGGIGLLALHMAQYAKRVICIEANVAWSWTFASILLQQKPKNVSYLFGSASEFYGDFKGDVALFLTHSDAKGIKEIGSHFAPEVIDVYGEVTTPEWNHIRDIGDDVIEKFTAMAKLYDHNTRAD